MNEKNGLDLEKYKALYDFQKNQFDTIKAHYSKLEDKAIKYQLFGTAPLVGAPKLLVYGTIHPNNKNINFELKCIDYIKYKSVQLSFFIPPIHK